MRLAQHGAWARVGVRWFYGMAGGPITPCALQGGNLRLSLYLHAPPDLVIGAGRLVAPPALAIGEGGYPAGYMDRGAGVVGGAFFGYLKNM